VTRAALGRAAQPATRRAASARTARRSGLGGTLVGVFIGIALGLGLAAAVAFYLMKSGNPYQAAVSGGARDSKDPGKSVRGDAAGSDKPRFDFYKILPGVDEPKQASKSVERVAPDKATLERSVTPEKPMAKAEDAPPPVPDKATEPPARAPKPGERFWIQAGSFTNENDAENLKAQLALSGWEASVQQATLPDKGVRYRVRLGPYDNTGELNRVKSDLAKRGVDIAVIKGQ
jgi:cell division protein FtsN